MAERRRCRILADTSALIIEFDKVLEGPDGGLPRVKPEYDDVLVAARQLGQAPLDVARAAQRGAEELIANSKE